MKVVYVAAAALISPDGDILLAQRPRGKSMAGLWELPGGKIEAGETPEAALIRELEEELAVDIAPADLSPLTFASHAYDTFHLVMPVFECRAWTGEMQPREHQDLAWVAPSRLSTYPAPQADIPLFGFLDRWYGPST